jgi:hypothetical protein
LAEIRWQKNLPHLSYNEWERNVCGKRLECKCGLCMYDRKGDGKKKSKIVAEEMDLV